MTAPHNMPRQEDVTELDLGNTRVSVVKLTNENREYMLEVALSMYLGERCKYCLKEYTTLKDLENTVWAGNHEHGRLACEDCWKLNNE